LPATHHKFYIILFQLKAILAALTLVVESVYPVDGGALMVAAEQEKVLGIFDLVRQQETNGLKRLLSCKLLTGIHNSHTLLAFLK
jgi:hypothetical protein